MKTNQLTLFIISFVLTVSISNGAAPDPADLTKFKVQLDAVGTLLPKIGLLVNKRQESSVAGSELVKLGNQLVKSADAADMKVQLHDLVTVPPGGAVQSPLEKIIAGLTTAVGNPGNPQTATEAFQIDKIIAKPKADMGDLLKDTASFKQDSFSKHVIAFGNDLTHLGFDLQTAGAHISTVLDASLTNASRPYFNVFAGIVTLNPFEVGSAPGTNFFLAKNSTKVFGTIQINYSDRYAWGSTTFEDDSDLAVPVWLGADALSDVLASFDLQVRVGYVFSQGGATNASTILGSGDFVGEFALGLRDFAVKNRNSLFVHSFNFPEVNVSLVTDRSFADVHSTVTAGLAYVASFPSLTPVERSHFLLRTGAAYYELPRLKDGSNIEIQGTDIPKFKNVFGWALETEISLPIGGGLSLMSGARVYPQEYPRPWTVWVGVSLSWDKVKSFLPLPSILTKS